MKKERLDKVLAKQGISRKQSKLLIKNGAVCINGKTCFESAFKVDLGSDTVECDGIAINSKKHVYIMMNKPAGVLSAARDKKAKTVIDLIPDGLFRKNLSVAGRLDKDTTGLLIISDDGEFIHSVISPRKNVYKLYHAVLENPVTEKEIRAFKEGLTLDGGEKCRPADLVIIDDGELKGNNVHIRICEGKFHQVKRMAEAVGNKVIALKRISIGNLSLDDDLALGYCREMTKQEAFTALAHQDA